MAAKRLKDAKYKKELANSLRGLGSVVKDKMSLVADCEDIANLQLDDVSYENPAFVTEEVHRNPGKDLLVLYLYITAFFNILPA